MKKLPENAIKLLTNNQEWVRLNRLCVHAASTTVEVLDVRRQRDALTLKLLFPEG